MSETAYSNSEINCFDRCRLEYQYRYNLHLQSIEDDSGAHHTTFGKAFHSALEVLYTKGDMKLAKQAMRDGYPVQLDPNDMAKTAENACFTLEKYWEHYNQDRDWEIISVVEERNFRDDGFGVKPDLVVHDRNENILLIDHKTTGAYLNYDYFARYDPNSQISHYIQWCKEKHGHCDGFVVNAVSFRYRQRAYKGEPAGFYCSFERQTFNRTAHQLATTIRATEEAIADIEHCRETGYWRPNEQSTTCKFCSYKRLCSAGWSWEEDSELILNQMRRICDKPISKTDEHCQLDLGHGGKCDSSPQVSEAAEFVVEV